MLSAGVSRDEGDGVGVESCRHRGCAGTASRSDVRMGMPLMRPSLAGVAV